MFFKNPSVHSYFQNISSLNRDSQITCSKICVEIPKTIFSEKKKQTQFYP